MAIKKFLLPLAAVCLVAFFCSPVVAAIILDGPTGDANKYINWDGTPAAQVQDGHNFLGDNPEYGKGYVPAPTNELSSGDLVYFNPATDVIDFTVEYEGDSGRFVLNIIHRRGDLVIKNSNSSNILPAPFRGGFEYIRVNLAGAPSQTITVTDFTVNGELVASTSGAVGNNRYYYLYNDDMSLFTDLTITGTITFSALDGAAPPRLEIALGLSQGASESVNLLNLLLLLDE